MAHKHHIIPRHQWKKKFGNLKGFNTTDNVVWLTLEQHAQAHHLLWELDGSEFDKIAWRTLSGLIGHEEARIQAVKFANTGLKRTDKQKKQISDAKRGQPTWNKGVPITEKQRRNQSLSAQLSLRSQEARRKLAEERKGLPANKLARIMRNIEGQTK
jgi:hypothetical protein